MWQLETTSAPTRAQGDLAVRGIVCAEVDVGCGLAACSHPKVIAMLKQGGAKLKHWASAARYATYLVNMEPLERRGDRRSPHEHLTGKPPNLAPVRTYFSKMWGAVSAEQREHARVVQKVSAFPTIVQPLFPKVLKYCMCTSHATNRGHAR